MGAVVPASRLRQGEDGRPVRHDHRADPREGRARRVRAVPPGLDGHRALDRRWASRCCRARTTSTRFFLSTGFEGARQGPRALAVSCSGLLAAYLIGAIPVGYARGAPRRAGWTSGARAAAISAPPTCCARSARAPPSPRSLGDIVKGYAAVSVARAARRPRPRGRRRARSLAIVGKLLAGLPAVPRRQGRGHRVRRVPRARAVGDGARGPGLGRRGRDVPLLSRWPP